MDITFDFDRGMDLKGIVILKYPTRCIVNPTAWVGRHFSPVSSSFSWNQNKILSSTVFLSVHFSFFYSFVDRFGKGFLKSTSNCFHRFPEFLEIMVQRFGQVVAVFSFLLLNLFRVYGEIPTTLQGPFKPVTVPLDGSFRGHAIDLPDTDPRVKRNVTGFEPEQISVSLSRSHDSIWISWVTGEFQIGANIKPLDPKTVASVVHYGRLRFPMIHKATGESLVYSQLYPFEGLENYTSGIIHHVRLTGLEPNTLYYYRCGDPSKPPMSDIQSFKTMPVSGPRSYPSKIALIGDLGLTYNTTSTIDHLTSNNPDLILLVGDVCYANLYLTNGTGSDCYSCSFSDTPIHETYQPRWDYWGRFMKSLVSKVPIMMVQGNHEIEEQAKNQTFASYISRFAFPSKESRSSSPFYYSFDAGGIHFIVLGAYVAYNKSDDQYKWLHKDLKSVNRDVTPWLIATWHPPWYTTYTSHYREAECMKVAMEDLLYEYGVDIVFSGHQLAMVEIERKWQSSMLMNQATVQNHPLRLTNLWVDFVHSILHQDQQLVTSVGIDNLNIAHTGKLALAMAFSRMDVCTNNGAIKESSKHKLVSWAPTLTDKSNALSSSRAAGVTARPDPPI